MKRANPDAPKAAVDENRTEPSAHEAVDSPDPFQSYEGIEIDRLNRRVRRFGREMHLTPREFDLLTFLVLNAGSTLSREYLLNAVWQGEEVDPRTVDRYIGRLRKAINRGLYPDPIKSVQARGYQYRDSFDQTCSKWLANGKKKLRLPTS